MTLATQAFSTTGIDLPRLGLGCMGMSDGIYGPADRAESIATVHAAQEAGIVMFDTGDFYGMGDNEMLLREALSGGRRKRAFIAVKMGAQRDPDGAWLGFDGSPAAVKTALAYTLKRLGTDHVDLYMPARLDPNVPIEETIGAIGEMVRAGYVRHIGVSELGADTIRRAAATHSIAALQIEYSLMSRGIEAAILPTCRELGIAVTAYGVLARGLIGGSALNGAKDFRAHSPRFMGDALAANQRLVAALETVGAESGHTGAQLAIAWVLSRGGDIFPLVGARSRKRLAESLGALDIALTPDMLARIEAAMPAEAVVGERYPAHGMASLDSERTTT
jgi:aryl-alcohol dehydrogenase-like predicted oxidoreductase